MRFHILFTVSISHAYYNEVCKDFSFIIPADTAQLLRNGKLIVQRQDGKLYVLFEGDETVSLAEKTLRIGLKLLNPFFSNFTDFNFNSSTPIYRNATNPKALAAVESMTLVGQIFSHRLTKTVRPVTAILKDVRGQVLQTDTITTTNNRSTVSYDITGQAAGIYSVEESYPGNTETVNYYSDTELQRQGIFSVIEIEIDSNFYDTAPEFAIAFAAKEEILKYYVVANKYTDPELQQLAVLDTGFTEDQRTQVNFTKVNATAFTTEDIPPALLGNSNAKVVLFKSAALVQRQQKARQKIQLLKNGDVLIPHLPQPSPDRANSDLIIQLSKP
ncbi:MAG TPA: hypothetical protein DDZ80_10205 [Cyanobacteria bacterium UBA8803]|nr:hypothetical protein [Cyanobacteria bacterium UBA9273]HBL58864.1 hypothetical protein [Cyanobacteria bacterium UBA8803]